MLTRRFNLKSAPKPAKVGYERSKVDRHKELVQLIKEGKTRDEIMEELGCTYSTLVNLAYRAGIELPFKRKGADAKR